MCFVGKEKTIPVLKKGNQRKYVAHFSSCIGINYNSKQDVGFDFRDLEKFNNALLAKEAWRLLTYSNTLFVRMFKTKYYKDGFVLQDSSHRKQSYGWSSILNHQAWCSFSML